MEKFYMKSYNGKEFYNKYYDDVYYIFGFFNRVFFGIFSKSKIKLHNNLIKKRYYSNFFKIDEELRVEMMNDIVKMFDNKIITLNEFKTLERYIENNVVHIKFGEAFIQEDEKVIIEAYDLTTKGGEKYGKVYFHLNGEKDEYIKVYENREGVNSYINKIPIRRSFNNIEEFKKKIRIVERKELEKKGIDEKGEEEIIKKLINMHKDRDIEMGSFDLNEFKMKKERKIEFKEYEKKSNDNNDDNLF